MICFVLEVILIGIFGLIVGLVGSYGFEKLLLLGYFVLVLYVVCVLYIVVVYSVLLLVYGLNLLKFFWGVVLGM